MSPALRGEVANFINSAWLQNVPFFNPPGMRASEKSMFCTDISLKLKPEAFAPQELVIKTGEPTEKFYLLQRGVMAKKGRILGTGDYAGHDFVLHKQRRNYMVRAITYVDVFSLSKRDLEKVMSSNSLPTIAPRVRLFAIQMSLRKAFIAFSKGKFRLRKRQRSAMSPGAEHRNPSRPQVGPEDEGFSQSGSGGSDVLKDAEREIQMSQAAISGSNLSNSSRMNFPQGKPETRRNPRSPHVYSPSVSPGGMRMATGVAGSASKVLQLMADRHEQLRTENRQLTKAMETMQREITHSIGIMSGELRNQREQICRFVAGISVLLLLLVTLIIVNITMSTQNTS